MLKLQLERLNAFDGTSWKDKEYDEKEWTTLTESVFEKAFGRPSTELANFSRCKGAGEHFMQSDFGGGGMYQSEQGQNNFVARQKSFRAVLRSTIEQIEPVSSSEEIPFDEWVLIHPAIRAVSKSRFETKHYADAAESAFKEVNDRVKRQMLALTGEELDGAPLMQRAFSVGNPVIQLDSSGGDSGKNIQVGYMQIFAGAMTGIRNPKAHANLSIDPMRSIHFLVLASLLMSKLDEAGVAP
jgi:uncharacterized protein (TIGR02391 family)